MLLNHTRSVTILNSVFWRKNMFLLLMQYFQNLTPFCFSCCMQTMERLQNYSIQVKEATKNPAIFSQNICFPCHTQTIISCQLSEECELQAHILDTAQGSLLCSWHFRCAVQGAIMSLLGTKRVNITIADHCHRSLFWF
jgi:hypothetical protein